MMNSALFTLTIYCVLLMISIIPITEQFEDLSHSFDLFQGQERLIVKWTHRTSVTVDKIIITNSNTHVNLTVTHTNNRDYSEGFSTDHVYGEVYRIRIEYTRRWAWQWNGNLNLAPKNVQNIQILADYVRNQVELAWSLYDPSRNTIDQLMINCVSGCPAGLPQSIVDPTNESHIIPFPSNTRLIHGSLVSFEFQTKNSVRNLHSPRVISHGHFDPLPVKEFYQSFGGEDSVQLTVVQEPVMTNRVHGLHIECLLCPQTERITSANISTLEYHGLPAGVEFNFTIKSMSDAEADDYEGTKYSSAKSAIGFTVPKPVKNFHVEQEGNNTKDLVVYVTVNPLVTSRFTGIFILGKQILPKAGGNNATQFSKILSASDFNLTDNRKFYLSNQSDPLTLPVPGGHYNFSARAVIQLGKTHQSHTKHLLFVVKPNAPKDFRLATTNDNRTQTWEWELAADGYQQSLIFSKCFKRNKSDCENVTIANSSVLPVFNPSRPAHTMSYTSSISEIGEYLISLLAQSGNFTAQSTILYFKLGEACQLPHYELDGEILNPGASQTYYFATDREYEMICNEGFVIKPGKGESYLWTCQDSKWTTGARCVAKDDLVFFAIVVSSAAGILLLVACITCLTLKMCKATPSVVAAEPKTDLAKQVEELRQIAQVKLKESQLRADKDRSIISLYGRAPRNNDDYSIYGGGGRIGGGSCIFSRVPSRDQRSQASIFSARAAAAAAPAGNTGKTRTAGRMSRTKLRKQPAPSRSRQLAALSSSQHITMNLSNTSRTMAWQPKGAHLSDMPESDNSLPYPPAVYTSPYPGDQQYTNIDRRLTYKHYYLSTDDVDGQYQGQPTAFRNNHQTEQGPEEYYSDVKDYNYTPVQQGRRPDDTYTQMKKNPNTRADGNYYDVKEYNYSPVQQGRRPDNTYTQMKRNPSTRADGNAGNTMADYEMLNVTNKNGTTKPPQRKTRN